MAGGAKGSHELTQPGVETKGVETKVVVHDTVH